MFNGQFCATVQGSGTYVNGVTGSFRFNVMGIDWLCGTSIKIDGYDRYGRWKWWKPGGQDLSCFGGNWFTYTPSIGARNAADITGGSIQVTLQSWGQPVTSTWHGIY